jgi:hypothetical protein
MLSMGAMPHRYRGIMQVNFVAFWALLSRTMRWHLLVMRSQRTPRTCPVCLPSPAFRDFKRANTLGHSHCKRD